MNANIKKQLQNMKLSDLRFVCRKLGVSYNGNKSNIIKRLLEPLNRSYKIHSKKGIQIPTSISRDIISRMLTNKDMGYISTVDKQINKDFKEPIKERFKQKYSKQAMVNKYRKVFNEWIKKEKRNKNKTNQVDQQRSVIRKIPNFINDIENNPNDYILLFLTYAALLIRHYEKSAKELGGNPARDLIHILSNWKIFKEYDLNLRNASGQTCLIICPFSEQWSYKDESMVNKLASLLIKAGANVNIRDLYGNTALIYGCNYSKKWSKASNCNCMHLCNCKQTEYLRHHQKRLRKEMVEMLINNEADVNVVNDDNKTALYYAKWRGHPEIVEILENNGARGNIYEREYLKIPEKAIEAGWRRRMDSTSNKKFSYYNSKTGEISWEKPKA